MQSNLHYFLGALLVEAVSIGAAIHYVRLAIRNGFTRYIAGQLLMVFGFALSAAPPIVLPSGPERSWEFILYLGWFGVFSGLALSWYGRRELQARQ